MDKAIIMAITRQIIFLAKRDCIEELKALLKSTIEETSHYSYFINNFNQYSAHIEPFELEVL